MAERKIQFLPSGVDPVPVGERTPTARAASGSREPSTLWREVLGNLDDDDAHQAFIRASLAHGRLRLALDNYRALESMRPGDPIAARYLAQVAKTMEFGAMGAQQSRKIDIESNAMRRPLRVLVSLVIALVGVAAIYLVIQAAREALMP